MRKGLIEDSNEAIEKELTEANKQFRAFASTHEGLAVILEELEETEDELNDLKGQMKRLWIMTKKNATKEEFETALEQMNQTATDMVEEAIQTAAMIRKLQQFNGKRV